MVVNVITTESTNYNLLKMLPFALVLKESPCFPRGPLEWLIMTEVKNVNVGYYKFLAWSHMFLESAAMLTKKLLVNDK